VDAIILAAGYGIRLYPLTENTPKPLLKIGEKPIIERLIRKLERLAAINKIYIVTNEKFEKHFKEWLDNFSSEKPIELINDGTNSNETRLGAFGDVQYAITSKKIENDIMVVAGDNLFELDLEEVIAFFKKRNSNVIVLHDVKDFELAKNYGIVELEDTKVINFEEKPLAPKTTLASTGIYLFPKKTTSLISKYVSQGNNLDKTGSFIEWLHKRDAVHSYVTIKKWYDIGNFEQLEKANKYYREK